MRLFGRFPEPVRSDDTSPPDDRTVSTVALATESVASDRTESLGVTGLASGRATQPAISVAPSAVIRRDVNKSVLIRIL
jgi:hypothetical protein